MRILTVFLLLGLAAFAVSCSGAGVTAPDSSSPEPGDSIERSMAESESNRWEWGCWKMYVPEDHSRVEILPVRSGEFHYNVKVLLEEAPCDNCLSVSKFVNNGDGTISVDIKIRHPFPGDSYFTGFDVRGIFYTTAHYNIEKTIPLIDILHQFPALETGDPQLLNPDGYTDAYHPSKHWLPPHPIILEYQPGGDLGGTYDEDDIVPLKYDEIWPYKCFYSSEERRQFPPWEVITRTYHIALPPGEWEFGYSVDAVWAQPDNVPVTNIVTDFPMQANTLDLYRLDMFVSGPLQGSNPVTITLRGYNHFPELLKYYLYPDGWPRIYTNLLPSGMNWNPANGPNIVNDEYVEAEFELVNESQLPPGCYPVVGRFPTNGFDGTVDEQCWFRNARIYQILWVTVES